VSAEPLGSVAEVTATYSVRRVYDFPAGADRLIADAIGVRAVLVEGTIVREDGRDAVDPRGLLPGRVLRGS
jgi:hypothetical protein